jgi:uncharacterized protein
MDWIVLGEKNGKIQLVSKSSVSGLIPKGSYLTIDQEDSKFILRVEESVQHELYSPTPMIVDMDLQPLKQDQKCKNIILAYRIKDITNRTDGFIDYIKPLSKARRANQEEIDIAMGGLKNGPIVFPSTVYYGKAQLLKDERGRYITTRLPEDLFYHQTLVCGKTGTGKTVATKYLAQYFVEELNGAVLAINVKEVDFLKMNKPSITYNENVLEEWKVLGAEPHGVENFIIYYPANTTMSQTTGVDPDVCKKITLNVENIEPESLTGLLQGISDVGAQNLPNIFRSWQEGMKEKMREGKDGIDFTFSNFVKYFSNGVNNSYTFITLNKRGDTNEIKLHSGTFENIRRNLDVALNFFDNPDAECIDETDILTPGKLSVIDVTTDITAIQFGSILLRDLLHRIVTAKRSQTYDTPLLIIIDEVHRFYQSEESREALGELDTICRTGRSQKLGVIFSSQNPGDIPRGLSSVINTKIFFKTDAGSVKTHGIFVNAEEMEILRKGFAAGSIYDLSELKFLKFPLSFAGVFEDNKGD